MTRRCGLIKQARGFAVHSNNRLHYFSFLYTKEFFFTEVVTFYFFSFLNVTFLVSFLLVIVWLQYWFIFLQSRVLSDTVITRKHGCNGPICLKKFRFKVMDLYHINVHGYNERIKFVLHNQVHFTLIQIQQLAKVKQFELPQLVFPLLKSIILSVFFACVCHSKCSILLIFYSVCASLFSSVEEEEEPLQQSLILSSYNLPAPFFHLLLLIVKETSLLQSVSGI